MPVYTSNPENVVTGGTGGTVVGPSEGSVVTPGSNRLLPAGGTTGQVLTKDSNTDYDVSWQPGGGGGGAVDSVNGLTGVVVIDDANIVTTDVTTNNATSAKHGWLPKLSNVVTEFLNGQGGWTVPAGANWANTNLTYTGNRTHDMSTFSWTMANGASFSEWVLDAVQFVLSRYDPSFRNAKLEIYGTNTNSGTLAKLTATGAVTESYFLAKGDGNAEIKGLLYLPNYNVSVPGTAAYLLGVDASGNVITTTGSGGSVTSVNGLTGVVVITDANISTSDVTTNNVSSTKHGWAPKSPADATQFLNGAATPAFAAVKDSDLSTSDITTNNATSSKHGFLPKLSNVSTEFLNGQGNWATPSGGGGGGTPIGQDPFRAIASALGDAILAESLGRSRNEISGTTNFTDGVAYYIAIYIPTGGTITGVSFYQTNTASYTADNSNEIQLYTYSGGSLTEVATTGNIAGLWQGTVNTFISTAFTTPYVASAGLHYIGMLYNNSSASTNPTIGAYASLQGASLASGLYANSAKSVGSRTGQTSLPSSETMSNLTASLIQFYFALY